MRGNTSFPLSVRLFSMLVRSRIDSKYDDFARLNFNRFDNNVGTLSRGNRAYKKPDENNGDGCFVISGPQVRTL